MTMDTPRCCWFPRVVRRWARHSLLLVLLTFVAQHAIWASINSDLREFQYVIDEPHSILDRIYNMDSTWNQSDISDKRNADSKEIGGIEGSLTQLLTSLTQPTRRCRKMVQLGGLHCKGLPDGSKKVCLDYIVYPGRDFCLGYSFGVGNDLTFDRDMANFGCLVFAFDQDKTHIKYPRSQEGVVLVKIRLGTKRLIANEKQVDGSLFKYIYRPMDDIQRYLKHSDVTLDYLKMDIEGDEWAVFTDSVFKTDILQRTKQLALEFHLNDLNSAANKTEHQRQDGIKKYQSVIDGLGERGFELVWFEPNFKLPFTNTIGDRTFHIFGEMLWVNANWKKPQVIPKVLEKKKAKGITRRTPDMSDIGWSWVGLRPISVESIIGSNKLDNISFD
ncbi:unnamed protein product [Meganyctiphanes norvegica]|uniref:Methyltransferase domain-containing protein n=1 Tax=Meganyctiphanes norvegica TaxID=48144 RepID=A0AAV2R6L4_MEGNR